MRKLATLLKAVAEREGCRASDVFGRFVFMTAAALRRDPTETGEALKDYKLASALELRDAAEVLFAAMRMAPPYTDLLGPFYMHLCKKEKRPDEVYTPVPVARHQAVSALLLARKLSDSFAVLEPACGSGIYVLEWCKALLAQGLELSTSSFELWDLNRTACDMAYINLTLNRIPAIVIHGETLEQQVIAAWRTPSLKLEDAA